MNLVHLVEDFRGAWKRFKKINIRRKIANTMAVFLILSFMPSPAISQKKAEPWTANIKIDTSNAAVLTADTKKIEITVGESEHDKKEKIAAENAAKAKLVATAYAAERYSVPADTTTDFRSIYQSAGAQYGVPWQVLEAVHQVETGKSGSTSKSSAAGAMGPMQFLPSTWRVYGVDADGDGSANITDVTDAIYGAAHLLAAGGAAEGRVPDALFSYNHSTAYVNKVLSIAREIGYSN